MLRRYRILQCLLATCVLSVVACVCFVAIFALCCEFSPYRVTREQELRLRHGMTKMEVIALLGKPHNNETVEDDFWIYWTQPPSWDPLKISFEGEKLSIISK